MTPGPARPTRLRAVAVRVRAWAARQRRLAAGVNRDITRAAEERERWRDGRPQREQW